MQDKITEATPFVRLTRDEIGKGDIPIADLFAIIQSEIPSIGQLDLYTTQDVDPYTQRIASLRAAFEFLLDSDLSMAPERRREIKLRAMDFSEGEPNNKNTLKKLAAQLATIVEHEYSITPKKALLLFDKAEEYRLLSMGRPPLVTIDRDETGNYQVYAEQPLPALTLDLSYEYFAIMDDRQENPSWYTAMDPIEQRMLLKVLRSEPVANSPKEMQEKLVTMSSKLRSIPGTANFAMHHYLKIDKAGKVLLHTQDLRSSIISSRDIQNQSKARRVEHAKENLLNVIQQGLENLSDAQKTQLKNGAIKIPVLIQTLITPIPGSGSVIPDVELYDDKLAAITAIMSDPKIDISLDGISVKDQLNIIESNYPFNKLGKLYTQYISSTDKSDILESICENHPDSNMMHAALESYKKNYDTSVSNLFRSALEQIIIEQAGGIVHATCVSGKDRRAIEAMMKNALENYYEQNKKIPDDPNDEEFCRMFADIFISRHHQENAGQNAPGANGTKTPDLYVYEGLEKAIRMQQGGSEIFDQSDELADNNNLKKLKSELDNTVVTKDAKTVYELMDANRQRLPLEQNTTVIEHIKIIVNNDDYWKTRAQRGNSPEGIQEIQKNVNGKSPDLNKLIKLASKKGYQPANRHPDTQIFYQILSNYSQDKNKAINALIQFTAKMSTDNDLDKEALKLVSKISKCDSFWNERTVRGSRPSLIGKIHEPSTFRRGTNMQQLEQSAMDSVNTESKNRHHDTQELYQILADYSKDKEGAIASLKSFEVKCNPENELASSQTLHI